MRVPQVGRDTMKCQISVATYAAVGVAIGAAFGAATGDMAQSVAIGAALGAAAGYWLRKRIDFRR